MILSNVNLPKLLATLSIRKNASNVRHHWSSGSHKMFFNSDVIFQCIFSVCIDMQVFYLLSFP
jgi:hypothetical protein